MTALHQMGNDSENLALELDGFAGAILSPVNETPEDAKIQCAGLRVRHAGKPFSIILDPQLYYPKSERGKRPLWSYVHKDIETADLASAAWWNERVSGPLVKCAADLGAQEVCSPAAVPLTYSDAHYGLAREIAEGLKNLAGAQTRILQTTLVRMEELAAPKRAEQIASIVSGSKCDGVYLVFMSQERPRLEYRHDAELKGAMRLIAGLSAQMEVTVSFCGSEAILWRAAGAQRCASGKFFNLRRFTPGRFEEADKGGGQMAYWFEESLLAYLRLGDLIRVRKVHQLAESSCNKYGQQILAQLDGDPSKPWLGLSWRQYLTWFAESQQRVTTAETIEALLVAAETNWVSFEDKEKRVLMEEPRNDGSWVRKWRIALLEYEKD